MMMVDDVVALIAEVRQLFPAAGDGTVAPGTSSWSVAKGSNRWAASNVVRAHGAIDERTGWQRSRHRLIHLQRLRTGRECEPQRGAKPHGEGSEELTSQRKRRPGGE